MSSKIEKYSVRSCVFPEEDKIPPPPVEGAVKLHFDISHLCLTCIIGVCLRVLAFAPVRGGADDDQVGLRALHVG